MESISLSDFKKYITALENPVFVYDSSNGENGSFYSHAIERYSEVDVCCKPDVIGFKNQTGELSIYCITDIKIEEDADIGTYVKIVCGGGEEEYGFCVN